MLRNSNDIRLDDTITFRPQHKSFSLGLRSPSSIASTTMANNIRIEITRIRVKTMGMRSP